MLLSVPGFYELHHIVRCLEGSDSRAAMVKKAELASHERIYDMWQRNSWRKVSAA